MHIEQSQMHPVHILLPSKQPLHMDREPLKKAILNNDWPELRGLPKQNSWMIGTDFPSTSVREDQEIS